MSFLNRTAELGALANLSEGLAAVWGRRRIGKTRLLLEWCTRERGIYTVADQANPEIQRAYLARAIAEVLPGFADVSYPDWERLLSRLATDAAARGFTGPIVLDELPYLVTASPELPSVLQRWVDQHVKRARLRVAIAGSSQRMMQGLVLGADAPLYGRAKVLLDIAPLAPDYLADALGTLTPIGLIEQWAAWGGVPRYWELAAERRGSARDRLIELALDPMGPLFSEPDRLLLEELPPAPEVRPLLDAIGAGAHRLSEIAGRIGRAATSLAHPIDRLLGMGLVERETPYGEPARGGKRSLYKLADPFLRMWFRVVAPNRAALIAGTATSRRAVLDAHWDSLVATAWESLCRQAVPHLGRGSVGKLGPWRPAQRYWHGAEPEWDVVADSIDGTHTLVGEAWFTRTPASAATVRREAQRLATRALPAPLATRNCVRVLFVPALQRGAPRTVDDVHVLTVADCWRTQRAATGAPKSPRRK